MIKWGVSKTKANVLIYTLYAKVKGIKVKIITKKTTTVDRDIEIGVKVEMVIRRRDIVTRMTKVVCTLLSIVLKLSRVMIERRNIFLKC